MNNLEYIVDPLIGVIIGFGTNYIAVKMLFRPYKPIKIGKFTLPFTPGVIPKRREKLAEALGNTISSDLFTSEDIMNLFLSDEIKEMVVNSIVNEIINNESTIDEILLRNISEDDYKNTKEKIDIYLANKITNGLLELKLGDIIAKEGYRIIKEKASGNLLGKFISDSFILSITVPAGETVEEYIKENSSQKLIPIIDNEISNITGNTVNEIMQKSDINEEKLKELIEDIYVKIIENKMNNIFKSFNISEVVSKKINEMDVKQIEKLFMDVMKKELNAVINLGAVLGLLLGILNIFI